MTRNISKIQDASDWIIYLALEDIESLRVIVVILGLWHPVLANYVLVTRESLHGGQMISDGKCIGL